MTNNHSTKARLQRGNISLKLEKSHSRRTKLFYKMSKEQHRTYWGKVLSLNFVGKDIKITKKTFRLTTSWSLYFSSCLLLSLTIISCSRLFITFIEGGKKAAMRWMVEKNRVRNGLGVVSILSLDVINCEMLKIEKRHLWWERGKGKTKVTTCAEKAS